MAPVGRSLAPEINSRSCKVRRQAFVEYSLQAVKGLGMHSYWYISQDKLQALGAFDRGWWSRLRPNAK